MNFSRLSEEDATILAAGNVLRNYVFLSSVESLISRSCDLIERLGDWELKVSLFIFIKKTVRHFKLAKSTMERYTPLTASITLVTYLLNKVISGLVEKCTIFPTRISRGNCHLTYCRHRCHQLRFQRSSG